MLRGRGYSGLRGWDYPFFAAAFLTAAHLLRCAAAILFRAAALIVRFPVVGWAALAGSGLAPSNIRRISTIRVSILVFCASKPSRAAVRISLVSFMGICLSTSLDSSQRFKYSTTAYRPPQTGFLARATPRLIVLLDLTRGFHMELERLGDHSPTGVNQRRLAAFRIEIRPIAKQEAQQYLATEPGADRMARARPPTP